MARWRLLEQAARDRDASELADGLVAFADAAPPALAGALRFLAAQLSETHLGDRDRADGLYEQARQGNLNDVVALKRVFDACAGSEPTRGLRLAERMLAEADRLGDLFLSPVLGLRACELLHLAGEIDRAEVEGLRLLDRSAGDAWDVRRFLEDLLWRERRWNELVRVVASEPDLDRNDRVLLAALQEHALFDPEAAASALVQRQRLARGVPVDDRLVMRTLQRLLVGRDEDGYREACQREADATPRDERRAQLYLAMARIYLGQPALRERALTHLFWVLDHDADNLTALRLIEHIARQQGDGRVLAESLGRQMELIDDPERTHRMGRELATWFDGAGDEPARAVELYARQLEATPDDADAAAALERLYEELGRTDALLGLLRRTLKRPIPMERRISVLIRLGEVHEEQLRDPFGARTLYEDALACERPETTLPPGLMARAHAGLARVADAAPQPTSALAEMASTAPDGHDTSVPVPSAADVPTPDAESLDGAYKELISRLSEEGEAIDPDADAPTRADSRLVGQPPPMPALEDPLETPLPGSGGVVSANTGHPAVPALAAPSPLATGDIPSLDVDVAEAFVDAQSPEAPRAADPGRMVIARKLARSRSTSAQESWPDHDDAQAASAARALDEASDPDARVTAAQTLAARYEAIGRPEDAIRAYRESLAWRAGDQRAIDRLIALCREVEDWKGLADMLSRAAERTGDRRRKRDLLLEIARLHTGPLIDPGGAVAFYRQVLKIDAATPGVVDELAAALKADRRWDEYVEVLAISGLADEDASPERNLELGRVYLYRLGEPEKAAVFIERAAAILRDPEVLADLAAVRAAQGGIDEALGLLDSAIRRADEADRGALLVRQARLMEERADNPEGARAAYRDAMTAGVRDPSVLDRLEHLAVEARDWESVAEIVRIHLEDARQAGAADDELRELAVRLGHLYFKRLDAPDKAAHAFIEALELRPRDASLNRVIEGLLGSVRDPDLHIRFYEVTLHAGTSRDVNSALKRLAGAYEGARRYDEALQMLEDLGRRSPADPDVLGALERVYKKAERWDRVVAIHDEALARQPDHQTRLTLLRRKAHALEVGMRDLAAATETWREVLRVQPDDISAVRAACRLLEAQKRWDELLEASERELALTADERQKAYILFRMGSLRETAIHDLDGAARCYHRALAFDARCFPALHGLREIAASQGHWATVIRYLEREVELWDEPREKSAVLARIGEIYATRLKDTHEAMRCYAQAIDVFPACIPAARALAEHAFRQQRWADAAPHYQVVTRQNVEKMPPAERSDIFYKRGVVALRLGRSLEAVESLKIALEFDPGHSEALRALVEAHAGLGALDGSGGMDEIFTRLGNRAGECEAKGDVEGLAEIDTLRGYAAEQALRLDEAAAFYQRAAERTPRNLAAHRPLVDLYLRERRFSEAAAVLRTYAERIEDAALAQRRTGGPLRQRFIEAQLQEGAIWCDHAVDPERAIECYQRVIQLAPGYREALFRTAQCAYLKGDFEAARRTMVRLLSLCDNVDTGAPERALYLFYLGRIYQSGDQQLGVAETHFRSALETDPRCAPAALALLRMLVEQGRDSEVDDLLTTIRGLLEAPESHGAEAAALRIFVAKILRARGDHEGARRSLATLAEGDGPGARDARLALARVHEVRGAIEAAAHQLYEILDRQVHDVHALRELAALMRRGGDNERLFHVLSVLELFRALPDDERAELRTLEEQARRSAERGGRTMDAEVIQLLAHPSWQSPLVPLLGPCEAAFGDRFPVPRVAQLRRADQVTPRSRHPFASDLKAIDGLLDVRDVEVYLAEESAELLELWPGDRPTMVVAQGCGRVQLTSAGHRFLVSLGMAWIRGGLTRLHGLEDERRLDLIHLLEGLFGPRNEGERGPGALLDGLPKKVADVVSQVVSAAGPGTLPALYTGESVLVGIERTTDRMALLGCGLLRPAIDSLARTESRMDRDFPRGGDLTWAVRGRERLQDLVKFSLSEAYHRARRAVGMSI
jgi:tetratricopeptide (TPR) repeat protein